MIRSTQGTIARRRAARRAEIRELFIEYEEDPTVENGIAAIVAVLDPTDEV